MFARDVALVGRGVTITAGQSQQVEPGRSITYTHTLTNGGTVTDTYTLSLASRRGWTSLLSAPVITLTAGASATVAVHVTVPLSTAAGITSIAMLTARSNSVPEVVNAVDDMTTAGAIAGVRYVAENGTDSDNSCLDSSFPCAMVKQAVMQAQAGDEVKLAGGEYMNPDMAVEGRFLTLDKSVTLLGGYAEGAWEVADPVAHPTVLDGENLGQILYVSTSGITVTVDGLTLQRAQGDSVYVQDGTLVMQNSQSECDEHLLLQQ